MTYLTRADWGAVPPKRPLTPWPGGQPSSKTLHYEGTDFTVFGKTRADYDRMVRGIQHYHMDISPEHYIDIAYNKLVSPLGDEYDGRGDDAQSGANGTSGANRCSFAVCYIGGPTTPFTAEAQGTVAAIGAHHAGPWFPHHHWFNTSCPGANCDAWLNLGEPAPGTCACPVPVPPAPPAPPSGDLAKFVAASTRNKLVDQDARRVVLAFQRNPVAMPDVQAVQDALNLVSNSNLVADGRFGFATLGAVTDLQRFFAMTVDGQVGNKTRGVLEKAIGTKYGV